MYSNGTYPPAMLPKSSSTFISAPSLDAPDNPKLRKLVFVTIERTKEGGKKMTTIERLAPLSPAQVQTHPFPLPVVSYPFSYFGVSGEGPKHEHTRKQ